MFTPSRFFLLAVLAVIVAAQQCHPVKTPELHHLSGALFAQCSECDPIHIGRGDDRDVHRNGFPVTFGRSDDVNCDLHEHDYWVANELTHRWENYNDFNSDLSHENFDAKDENGFCHLRSDFESAGDCLIGHTLVGHCVRFDLHGGISIARRVESVCAHSSVIPPSCFPYPTPVGKLVNEAFAWQCENCDEIDIHHGHRAVTAEGNANEHVGFGFADSVDCDLHGEYYISHHEEGKWEWENYNKFNHDLSHEDFHVQTTNGFCRLYSNFEHCSEPESLIHHCVRFDVHGGQSIARRVRSACGHPSSTPTAEKKQ